MIKPIAIAVIGLCAATATSFAQSTSPKSAAECQQLWTTADANKDSMLDMAELEANKAQMPTSLMKGTSGGMTGSTSSSSDATGSTTGTTGSSGNTASNSGTTGTTGSSDTTASTSSATGTGTSGGTTGSTAGSTTGVMISQQDFMTACTTGQ